MTDHINSDLLITFDPGVNDAGLAIFYNGKLRFAESIKGKRGTDQWLRARTGADQAIHSMAQHLNMVRPNNVRLVVEFPKVYPGGQTKNPNDQLIGAAMAGMVAMAPIANVTRMFPRDWKGTVEADVMTVIILKRLMPDELALLGPVAKNHNVVDACGIALKLLGRLK